VAPVRVILVEDNDVYRSTLELLLELREELDVVASVSDAEAALAAHARDGSEVVVADLRLPGLPGIELIRRLAAGPPVGIVCLTAEASDDEETEVLAAGAATLVRKTATVDELVGAIIGAAPTS
jgi:DNA-binding NarL/FixJ family response regulator